jgi:hypothetical protein
MELWQHKVAYRPTDKSLRCVSQGLGCAAVYSEKAALKVMGINEVADDIKEIAIPFFTLSERLFSPLELRCLFF